MREQKDMNYKRDDDEEEEEEGERERGRVTWHGGGLVEDDGVLPVVAAVAGGRAG